MKKIIIAGAIVAASAGAYIFTQQNSAPSHNVLDYIPADTPVFAALLEPFPFKDYLGSLPIIVPAAEKDSTDTLKDAEQPAMNFLLSLVKTYQTSLTDPDLLIKTFGLPNNLRSYFYTLGLSPVYKIEVANEQAIWDLLDKTELETGYMHKKGTLENISYRAYPFNITGVDIPLDLIVAINHGLLTITLNSSYHEPALLSQALGLTKAKHSLQASGVVEQLIKKHNFTQSSLGFINHVTLVKGLTTKDGNQLALQITNLEQKLGVESGLELIRNEQCATEFASIANNWPRSVSGYTKFDIGTKESTRVTATIVESNNQIILKALSEIRGYIPSYTADTDNVFSLAFGFDVSKLASTLNSVWGDLQTPSYSCQPLADIQAQITASGDSISMVGMGANMANGVQGISLGLLDYALSSTNGDLQIDSLDALITLSAENPQQLFNTAKMFLPELQHLQLASDSEPVQLIKILPIPPELNIDPQLAIKGQHIVIYNGKKGEQAANQLATETLSKNGLTSISLDLKKIFAAASLSGEPIPAELKYLTEYDMRLQMSSDVNEQGLISKSKINTKGAK